MTDSSRPRVLFVDDDPSLLAGIVRTLRSEHFQVNTASRPTVALDLLNSAGPFAAIVSDLHMPEMDGVTLLQRARQCAPDTIRLLFTGQPDLNDAIEAVNKGAIFRFIVKPCSRVILALTLKAAVEQYRLLTSERVLLEQTLLGSVNALIDVLARSVPEAFGTAARLRERVRRLTVACGISESWQVEMAAMLAQVGHALLPPVTLEKMLRGGTLSDAERKMAESMPAAVQRLFGGIPRLEPVLEIVRLQGLWAETGGPPSDALGLETVPWGARALRLALDLDALEFQGMAPPQALDALRARAGRYDAGMIEILEARISGDSEGPWGPIAEIAAQEVPEPPAHAAPVVPGTDSVTGLPDRGETERALGMLLEAGQSRYGLVLVLDNLSSIASRFGHAAADELFRAYGQFVERILPADHRLFRWSGPTLVALLPRLKEADLVRDEFRVLLENNRFTHTVRALSQAAPVSVLPRWTVFPPARDVSQFIEKIDSFVGTLLTRDVNARNEPASGHPAR